MAAAALPLRPMRLPLGEAVGLRLAEDLVAQTDLPPWPTVAMDGFAVCGSGPWRHVGDHVAGGALPSALREGECLGITTGSPMPDGCTGIVRSERVTATGARVEGPAEWHVRGQGEECVAGEVLVPAGARVTPVVLGLAAAAGHDALLVRSRVRVRVVVTGDELVFSGPAAAGVVRDALGPLLPPALAALGADVIDVHYLGDADGLLAEALAPQREEVLLCTGSTSRGPRDALRPALEAAGAEVLVGEVDCRPGHPMLLARLPGGQVVVGVPGNPLAAVASLVTLVEPLLAGLVPDLDRHAGETTADSGTQLVPATLQGGPTAFSGSAMLRGTVKADGLLIIHAQGIRWWPWPW